MIAISIPQIRFLRVSDASAKNMRICERAQAHFLKGDKLLFFAANAEAANYVDQILWRFPQEGFIPHVISVKSTRERIVITTEKTNVNEAAIVFNLCPEATETGGFEVVYELWDESQPAKLLISQKKYSIYQRRKLEIRMV